MPVSPSFKISPIARLLKLVTLGPLLLVSPGVLAQIIVENGALLPIDGNTPLDGYEVRTGSTLTANGATTKEITASTGSTLTLDNATTVTAVGTADGIVLSQSHATIANGSTVTSARTGLVLRESTIGASTALVSNSTINGGQFGAQLSRNSELTLESDAKINGTNPDGIGIVSFGGKITATGSTITGGLNGVKLFVDSALPAGNQLVLDKSTVEGLDGSAIVVDGLSQTANQRVNIHVNNGSSLKSGNGTLLEVNNGAAADFSADNSHLVGDILVDGNSSADVLLNNAATLTGRLENVENLTINNDALWVMVGDGQVQNLTLNGGGVQFGQPGQFFKLSLDSLSGEGGTFHMHKDFTTGQVDTLTVAGQATGNHLVALKASATEPTSVISVPVVQIGGGDATFALAGGAVDLGVFSYDLIKQGNNAWHLSSASKVISPGTQSVIALFNAAPTIWYGELSTLRSRMGEVRMDQGKAGGWIRAYGNKFDIDASAGVAYKQTQQGISLGADAPLPMGDGQWLIGVMGGYSKSDLDMSRGTTAEVDSYYLGAYTTWLDKESGYYFDGVLKYNRLQNESDVRLSDGTKTKGNYDTNGVGASLEFGRHIKMGENFVEPYAQLAGAVFQGQSYELDNGLSADGDRTHSLLGELGVTVGRDFHLGEGKVVQPYLRAAYVHEFADNNNIDVNNYRFNNDLSGSRGKLGAGVAMTLTDKVSLHTDFDYSHGNKIEQPWGVNAGLQMKF